MKYQRGSFSVAVSDGKGSTMCAEKGHSAADAKGNCLCCGAAVSASDTGYGSKTCYVELMGGPRDGEIVSTDDATIAGRDVLIDGELYHVVDQERGLVRLQHVVSEPAAI